jgi:osmotically-inducible protein OsmY
VDQARDRERFRVCAVTGSGPCRAVLAGVRNVWNDIEISYDIDPVDVDLHVQDALDRSALVPDGSDVTADTKDNVITLTGMSVRGPNTTQCSPPR